MTKILVLGDSGVGKTSWLFAMNGQVPRNIFKSTHDEKFVFSCTQPSAIFVAIHSSITNQNLKKHCKGTQGLIVLYNNNCSPLAWLHRVNLLYPRNTIPVIVCCHGIHTTAHDLSWLHRHVHVEHAFTSIEQRAGIIDCANRILTRVRQNLPSPLSESEMQLGE